MPTLPQSNTSRPSRIGLGVSLQSAVGVPGEYGFLSGGGEMGARMRAFDWATTPLGLPNEWPNT
jgi:hypothetical protein